MTRQKSILFLTNETKVGVRSKMTVKHQEKFDHGIFYFSEQDQQILKTDQGVRKRNASSIN